MAAESTTYEIAYLISPDVPEEDVFAVAGRITGAIQDARGLVGKIQEPKRRRLAYPIAKHDQAYFGWTVFSIAPERLAGIVKAVRNEGSILRSLVVEEVKRPIAELRPSRRPFGRGPGGRPRPIAPFEPAAPAEEDQAKNEALDRQLEEVLNR